MDSVSADTRHNYEVECRLADLLRSASASERRSMYANVYDEFFREARNFVLPVDPREIARQVRLATRFLPENGRYLEIGAGTCAVASQIALSAAIAYAVEVSAEIVPPNVGVEVLLSDGVTIPVDPESVDLVYSNQLMEHLHPEDASEQVRNIIKALALGGKYVCATPNRLTGPHDVSRYFGDTARGFHLCEYSLGDLRRLFLEAGFRDVRVAVALGGEVVLLVRGDLYAAVESVLARLPRSVRRRQPVRKFLNPGPVVAYR